MGTINKVLFLIDLCIRRRSTDQEKTKWDSDLPPAFPFLGVENQEKDRKSGAEGRSSGKPKHALTGVGGRKANCPPPLFKSPKASFILPHYLVQSS